MTNSSLKIFSILTLIGALCLNACSVSISDKDEVKGNGEIVEKILEQDEFSEIQINGFFKVVLHPGEDHSVTLTGDENLLNEIKVEIKGDRLYVSTDKNLKPKNELRVDVSFEELEHIGIAGAADMTSDGVLENDELALKISGAGNVALDVETEDLDVEIGGAGNLKLAGSADNSKVGISGAGNLESYDLKTHNTKIRMSGAGNVEVYADEELEINLSGLGRVSYRGNPTDIKKNVSGLGVVSEG